MCRSNLHKPQRTCQNKCANKCVPVTLEHPDAQDVRVTGNFCEWSVDGIPLSRGETGLWQTTLKLKPGRYEYRFLADGAWINDPDCDTRSPNPYGTENCVLDVV